MTDGGLIGRLEDLLFQSGSRGGDGGVEGFCVTTLVVKGILHSQHLSKRLAQGSQIYVWPQGNTTGALSVELRAS